MDEIRIKLGLHNHSQMSDGFFTVSGLLKVLGEIYDVIAITDHNVVTVPHLLQLQGVENLLILKGVEITFPSIHFLALEPTIFDQGAVGLLRSSSVKWIAHPALDHLNILDCIDICDRESLNGIEQYTTGFLQTKPSELFKGILYATDDVHVPSNLMTSWMEMDVNSIDKVTILEKLKVGDFEIKVQSTMEWEDFW